MNEINESGSIKSSGIISNGVNLLYIANARMPTEKAHGLQIAKMCEAFAKQGAKVTLVIPTRKNALKGDLFSYYNVAKTFSVVELPVKDTVRFGKIGFIIQSILFSFAVRKYVEKNANADYIFTRDLLPALGLRNANQPVCLEVHFLPNWSMKKIGRVFRNFKKIVSTNVWKKETLVELGIPKASILVRPNGVDETLFESTETKQELRQSLGLPDKPLALYAGHLYGWKGAHVAYKAAKLAPNVTFVLLGGTKEEQEKLRAENGDSPVLLIPQVPHSDVQKYLRASDVLLLPNVPSSRESEYETSPIKMFAYMASGTPIVASDLPSIREILDDATARFVKAGDAQSLAEGVEAVIQNPGTLGEEAKKRAREYTWDKRAEAILTFIQQ